VSVSPLSKEQDAITAALSRTAPFSRASRAERAALAEVSTLHSFPAGATVFLEGARDPAAWAVRSGRVRIMSRLSAGRTFQIERFGPGQLFGVCCRVGGGIHRYLCTATAESDLTAVRIPDEAFHAVYRRSPQLAAATCELCAGRLRSMRRRVSVARRHVSQRVAEALLALRTGDGSEVRATRHALAAWVDTAPETVFRVLAGLRRRGIVSTGRGTVRILDAAGLARAAAGERG
jgi:CRP-like cAMP-binding protein